MSKLKYLNRKEAIFKYCFEGLRDQFSSESELEEWYGRIESDDKKDLFLKVASYYAALVKCGDWHVTLPDSDPVIGYFTNSYKYIAIFSLIESLSDLNYVDFYQYLERINTGIRFPIKKKDLDGLYRRYKKDYGAIRRCIAFFEGLSPSRQKSLIAKLEVKGTRPPKPTIENFAKYLYQLRSDFVHNAELVHPVSVEKWMELERNKVIICSLSLSDTMQFFEEGLVLWFEAKKA